MKSSPSPCFPVPQPCPHTRTHHCLSTQLCIWIVYLDCVIVRTSRLRCVFLRILLPSSSLPCLSLPCLSLACLSLPCISPHPHPHPPPHPTPAWKTCVSHAKAQREHQVSRLLNLELADTHGAGVWLAHNGWLEGTETQLGGKVEGLKRRIAEVRGVCGGGCMIVGEMM